jgi:hypothetical protein
MEHWWNGTDRGKPQYSEKNLSNATSPTTNPTRTDLGSNPVIRGERPATDGLIQLKTEFSPNCMQKLNTHRAVNVLRLGYKNQSVSAVCYGVRA